MGNGFVLEAVIFIAMPMLASSDGIEPDVVVPQSDEELRKLMLQHRYLEALGEKVFFEKYGFEPVPDKQLDVALEVVRNRMVL